jgi:hypothetical protein
MSGRIVNIDLDCTIIYVLSKALGKGIFRTRGLCEVQLGQAIILRMLSPLRKALCVRTATKHSKSEKFLLSAHDLSVL